MSLVYQERPADGTPEGLLVLHHGRGADEHDLLGLADVLDPERRLHVVTPGGPLQVPGWPGKHWYLVPRVGYPDPDTFRAAYADLARFHDETWERTGTTPANTVFGGFSMGSVMSYSLGLGPDRPAPAGILAFSGFIPTVDGWQPDLQRGTRAFIAHGRRDPVMDVQFARPARDQLSAGGLDVTNQESDAAHPHDPAPGSMLRMGVAPCSPFSVTEHLMREAAALARERGVRLHTHLAETLDEDVFCRSRYGCSPAEYADGLGWLGDDVWLAHCVHVDEAAAKRLAVSGTAVAHCPTSNARLGAGLAPVAMLRETGVPVGLGVDGSASNEESSLVTELHAALMLARLRGGPAAMSARDALALATIGGARTIGRADELGSLEPGKLADLAVWRVDGLAHAGCEDPVAALVLGSRPPLVRLVVGGVTVVEDDVLLSTDEEALARRAATAARTLLARSGR